MFLINAMTLRVEEFVNGSTPRYAILSHTWDRYDITFQDLRDRAEGRESSREYDDRKLVGLCKQTILDGLTHAWLDSCCIDKSSSASVSEAINSMFDWFANSTCCYAYLSDVDMEMIHTEGVERTIRTSRWFTRGWTLPELIAPRRLVFFTRDWTEIGTKSQLAGEISRITRIHSDVLSHKRSVTSYSVATRMSWAADRHTTRIEDMAYCLMGLFGISMPLLYGEGKRAFRRLQQEIMRNTNDLTLLAWSRTHPTSIGPAAGTAFDLLAEDPSDFAHSAGIEPTNNSLWAVAVTDKGVWLDGPADVWAGSEVSGLVLGQMGLVLGQMGKEEVGIPLVEVEKDTFARLGFSLVRGNYRTTTRRDGRLILLAHPLHLRVRADGGKTGSPSGKEDVVAKLGRPSDRPPLPDLGPAQALESRGGIARLGAELDLSSIQDDPPDDPLALLDDPTYVISKLSSSAASPSVFSSDAHDESTRPSSLPDSSQREPWETNLRRRHHTRNTAQRPRTARGPRYGHSLFRRDQQFGQTDQGSIYYRLQP